MIEAQQFDLFTYPHAPGWKRDGTSALAAPSASQAETLREAALEILKTGNYTADEIAEKLTKSVLSIRPRMSELNTLGKIKETSQRRRNASGKSAVVWRYVNPNNPF